MRRGRMAAVGRRLLVVRIAAMLIVALWAEGCASLPARVGVATPTPIGPFVHQVAATKTTSSSDNSGSGSVSAVCPPSELLLSGGWAMVGIGWRVSASRVYNIGEWRIDYQQFDVKGGSPSATVTAYAMCLANPPANLSVEESEVQVHFDQPNYPYEAVATCPSGTTIVGGGFFAAGDIGVSNSTPVIDIPGQYVDGWRVSAGQVSGYDYPGDYYEARAMCLSPGGVPTPTFPPVQFSPSVSSSVGSLSSASSAVTCPVGQYLTAGGFDVSKAAVVITRNAEQSTPRGTEWGVQAVFQGSSSFNLEAYSLCLTLPQAPPGTPTSTSTQPTATTTPTAPPA
jgi:hypothetical protein